jgi:hypothetical protein
VKLKIPPWLIILVTATATLLVWLWVGRDLAQWLGLVGTSCALAKKAGDVRRAETVTQADEADQVTDEVTQEEQNPSAEDVAEDINELTKEVE